MKNIICQFLQENKMKNNPTLDKALSIAYKFLNYRPRTEKEVRTKLINKKIDNEIIEAVIEKLKDYNYLNDRDFCKNWIDYRLKLKPMGKSRLFQELVQKGVAPQLVSEILESEIDIYLEEEVVRQLIKKQANKYLNKHNGLNKLKSFMLRRGFTIETVNKILIELGITETHW